MNDQKLFFSISENYQRHHDKLVTHLPILTLDEILKKELAISYYLDYLSILNLQKYVIFYLTAQGKSKLN